jgi:hypothetical protein
LASAAQAHTASATAACGSVTFNWSLFAASGQGNGGENTPGWNVVFTPSGGGAPFTASGNVNFSGSSDSLTEAIPAENGTVVASSAWTSSQTRDGNANSYSATIPIASCPSITVLKQQQILGSGSGYTTAPLTGNAGQTVAYLIAVTNTGSVPVSLSFSDPHCDAGTIVGPTGPLSGGKLAAGSTVDYTCLHLLASGDAPQYTNTATEVATPPSGPALTVPSNTVVVNLPSAPTPTPTTSTPAPVTSVAAQKTSRTACTASAAKVSSISRVGSTRRTFVLRLRAAGIARVTFLLDGRVLKTLTHRSVRGGYYSVKVNPQSLSRGTHRVTARVSLSNSACAGVARSFKFVRAHTPAVTPAFTG